MQTQTLNISTTRAAIVKAMRADLGGYAAVVAHAVLSGKADERGYAATLRKELQLDAAMADHGKAWEKMDDAARDAARDVYFARFKKYAEKGVAIAACAAERGLNVLALHDLDQTSAIKAVVSWLVTDCGVSDIETLWSTFGFAGGNAKRGAKVQTPDAPAATPATPTAETETETESPLATASGPEAYAATIAAQMQAMSEDDRAAFIKALMGHIVDLGYSVRAEEVATA